MLNILLYIFQGLDASYYHQFQAPLTYPCYPGGYPPAYNLNSTTSSSNQLTSSTKASQGYPVESLPPIMLDHPNQYSTPSVLSSPTSPSPSIKTETSARCELGCSLMNVIFNVPFFFRSMKIASKMKNNRGRSKSQQQQSSPDPENHVERIFVWDLDETIIILHSLLTGTYAQRYQKVKFH